MSGTYTSGESYRKWKLSKAVASVTAFIHEGTHMKQERLKLYLVDIKYIRDLSHADNRVMSVSPQIGKSTRPFIGIIVVCNDKKYCVPFSSPKPKHQTMKNDKDFTKIYDSENKLIAVLNFNEMIPVDERVIQPFDMRPHTNDNENTRYYKRLTAKQLEFCRKNQDAIVSKANKLYQAVYMEGTSKNLINRCCDFKKLELVLEKFLSKI